MCQSAKYVIIDVREAYFHFIPGQITLPIATPVATPPWLVTSAVAMLPRQPDLHVFTFVTRSFELYIEEVLAGFMNHSRNEQSYYIYFAASI